MARVRRQAAVIPYRIRKERVEVALVDDLQGQRLDRAERVGRRRRTAARRGDPRGRGRSRPAGRRRAEAARPLSSRQRRWPLPGGCLPDARHEGARALAGRQAPAAALDAHPRCRRLLAGRAAAVHPPSRRRGRTGLLSVQRGQRSVGRNRIGVRRPGRRITGGDHQQACRRFCRRGTIRSPGTGSLCSTRLMGASGERARV